MAGKAPTHKLCAIDKETNDKNYNVGVAWQNADGSINIKLNPCIQLIYDPQISLTLFPNEERKIPPPPRSRSNEEPF